MNDDELLSIALRLKLASDEDAAQSQLTDGKPFLWLTGNRDALLRLAAAFLRTAAAVIADGECRADAKVIDHHQISNGKSDHKLIAVQRIDALPHDPDIVASRKGRIWAKDRVALIGGSVFGLIIICLLVLCHS